MKKTALLIIALAVWGNATNCLDVLSGVFYLNENFRKEFVEDSALTVNGGDDDIWYAKIIYRYNDDGSMSGYDRCVGTKCWFYPSQEISTKNTVDHSVVTEIYKDTVLQEIRVLFPDRDSVIITTYYEEDYDTTQMLVKYVRHDTLYSLNYMNSYSQKKLTLFDSSFVVADSSDDYKCHEYSVIENEEAVDNEGKSARTFWMEFVGGSLTVFQPSSLNGEYVDKIYFSKKDSVPTKLFKKRRVSIFKDKVRSFDLLGRSAKSKRTPL